VSRDPVRAALRRIATVRRRHRVEPVERQLLAARRPLARRAQRIIDAWEVPAGYEPEAGMCDQIAAAWVAYLTAAGRTAAVASDRDGDENHAYVVVLDNLGNVWAVNLPADRYERMLAPYRWAKVPGARIRVADIAVWHESDSENDYDRLQGG
jgi:hypothetical protein